jgi:hypothetical protein
MTSPTSVLCIPKGAPEAPAFLPTGCVLDLWEQGVDRRDLCATALARLVVAQPERVTTFADPAIVESSLRAALKQELASRKSLNAAFWFSAIVQFLEFNGCTDKTAAVYREVLDYLKSARGAEHAETHALAEELDRFLRRMGREKEAFLIRHELGIGPLMAGKDAGSLLALRGAAYDAFEAGCFAEAEAIYRHLLARDFEPGGTHCHLARALLALGRDADATAEVNSAWECRSDTDQYVIVRILFLKALLATLAGEDDQSPLEMLKETLLRNPGARQAWLIAPVLNRLQPRLTPQSHAFFTRMAQAVSGCPIE